MLKQKRILCAKRAISPQQLHRTATQAPAYNENHSFHAPTLENKHVAA
jgi:hypothetical protein